MNALLGLLPVPIVIMVLALIVRKTDLLVRLAAAAICLQLAIAAYWWVPLLKLRSGEAVIRHGFRLDSTAAFFVLLTSLVAAAVLTYCIHFFDAELKTDHPPSSRQIGQFYFFIPAFVIAMYVVAAAENLGFLWIGMEATTLFSAPLVYYYRTGTSLEATWKYLIVCSVGIALAFFGTALVYSASQTTPGLYGGSLSMVHLARHANALSPGPLRLGYVFILLGYGTKAGLFPLHSWLPDAHGEAPVPVSALLSGALLNCALIALWRVGGIMNAAGQQSLVLETLLPVAVLTVGAAALFLVKQHDLKRMLAYSSMENVGLMAVAVAIGSPVGFALQAANHSLVKVALFLVAGSILQLYGTKKIGEIKGMLAARPALALLFFAGIAAVAGTPPFGGFLAEWQILSVAASHRQTTTVVVIVTSLVVAFIALSSHAAAMLFGPQRERDASRQPARYQAVSATLLGASLALGLMLTPAVIEVVGGLDR